MKKIFLSLLVLFFSASPLVTFAIGIPYLGTNPPLLPCGGDYIDPATNHLVRRPPCTSVCEILVLLQRVIYLGITFVAFAVAPILLVYGGIRIITAAGSPERISESKKIITGTVIGVAIALGSFLIVNTFFWTMDIVFGGGQSSWSNIVC